jgi:hypothetical protein
MEISHNKDLTNNNNSQYYYAEVTRAGELRTTTSLANGGQIDAFGRLRVSQISTQLDIKQIHDEQPLFFDRVKIGGGLSTYVNADSASNLTTASDGDAVIVQTFQRSNYQSGKSHQIFLTFANMHAQPNITKRVGYFDSNTTTPFDSNKDGIWLESSNGTIYLVVSKDGTENKIPQGAWNTDKMDGTGKSGITLDFSKTQIVLIEFEWLGVGGARISYVVDMAIVTAHQFNHANVLSDVYMQSPNKPLRYEIRQTGAGSGTLKQICCTVGSEGSINEIGKILSVNNGVGFINANSTSSVYALLGLRLKSTNTDTEVDVIDYVLHTTTSTDLIYSIILNPTVAGTFNYADVTNSNLQIAKGDAVSNPSTNTVTGGTVLQSGYLKAGAGALSGGNANRELVNALRLGASITGVSDTIVLCVQPLTANADVYGAITWRERS